jgi:hypothetical protein
LWWHDPTLPISRQGDRILEPKSYPAGATGLALGGVLASPGGMNTGSSAIVQPSHLSGFYGSLECLKNISDIQYQTG